LTYFPHLLHLLIGTIVSELPGRPDLRALRRSGEEEGL
jgi:hypothetical protein